jgi:hypothetical protein
MDMSVEPIIDPFDADMSTPPHNPILVEYEARRCAICGAKYPPFGFGPPLTRPDATLWACAADGRELHARLSPEPRPAGPTVEQTSLFVRF